MWFGYSSRLTVGLNVNHPITLKTQFHIPNDAVRRDEVRYALKRNVENDHITRIVLLNERMYTPEELGVDSAKIEQRVVPHRLEFTDVLKDRPHGFLVFANNDIFFDETIDNLRRSDLAYSRKMCALLRYEFNGSTETSPLMGPRADSNDTFILHSNLTLTEKQKSLFNFKFGQPGCDNKVCYLFNSFGVEVVNDPVSLRTYHCHADPHRNYSLEVLKPPYLFMAPNGVGCPLFNMSQESIEPWVSQFEFLNQNRRLKHYLTHKEPPFCVPRVAGIENMTAFRVATNQRFPDDLSNLMKRNAGILFGDTELYAKLYLKAFEVSDVFASWEPWGSYAQAISHSLTYVHDQFKKPKIGAYTFDIFHYLHDPWTHALKGKRILIVSAFADMMREQPQAYDVDLFPDCTLAFLKPPLTQADEPSRPWEEEFADLCAAVDAEEFDVALCSCGGYGNPLCAHIFSTGRSAIYVGGVLQLYFGIYGKRWMLERPEMMRLHMKSSWKKPNVKPKGFETIEGGCYW